MKTDYLDRQSYPKDLTDTQWAEIEPLFVGMREYKHSKRDLTNLVKVKRKRPTRFRRGKRLR